MNNKLNIATISVGVFLAVACAILVGSFVPLYNFIVDQTLILSNNSATFSTFVEPPIPVYLKFYMFDIQNPDDVLYYGEKPILVEKGPYVYREHKVKKNITFDSTGKTIEYATWLTYEFDAEMSFPLTEEDKITGVNLVMVVAAAMEEAVKGLMWNLSWALVEEYFQLFETHTVGEWLFQGIELPHVYFNFSKVYIEPFASIAFNGTFTELLAMMGQSVDQIVDNKISYYAQYNGSTDGLYRVNSGKGNMDTYLDILQWNGASQLSWWNNTYCDMINGTDGTQFPPRFVDKKNVTVRMYVPQLCRSLYLAYQKEIDGLPFTIKRFGAPPEMLQSGDKNPDNKCYCGAMGCLGDSMLELTNCLEGLPIIMSTPHFYQGDGINLKNFIGLKPEMDKHQTFLDLQPDVGVPYEAHKRIQLNFLLMQNSKGALSFGNVREMVYPIFWADECAKMADKDVNQLKGLVVAPYTIAYAVGGTAIGLGVLLTAVGVFIRVKSG